MKILGAAILVACLTMLPLIIVELIPQREVPGRELQVTTPEVAPDPPDPLAMESQRLGRALIACRDIRREQLCAFGEFDCQTGFLYSAGLSSTFESIRKSEGDRRTQIKILWTALAACASGRDLAQTGRSLSVMDVK